MRSQCRGVAAALILWFATLQSVTAQSLPDGFIFGSDRTERVIVNLLSGQGNRNALSVLQSQTICVKNPNLARFLNEQDIRTQLVPEQAAPLAVRTGLCDMMIQGQAARAVRRLLRDASPTDDVPSPTPTPTPSDQQGPEILPLKQEFTASSGSATIIADIFDPSGVARTETGGALPSSRDGREYEFKLGLPNNYEPRVVTITATDRVGNSSAKRVSIRRLPACGPSTGLNVRLARNIQALLNELGFNAGTVDGIIGRGSCNAILRFDPTGIETWRDLRADLDRFKDARAGVSISARTSSGPTEAEQTVVVSVTDPTRRQTVTWVRVTAQGGGTVLEQQYQGRDLTFPFRLSPGDTRPLVIEALDAQTRPLAQTRFALRRLPDMTLILASPNLQDAQLETTDQRIHIMARVTNPWPGASVQLQTDTRTQTEPYTDTPLPFWIAMPDPGIRQDITFTLRDNKGLARAQQTVTLRRATQMTLSLTAEGLSGAKLESSAPTATVQVHIALAWPDTIVVYHSTDGPDKAQDYAGAAEFTVKMPSPGAQSVVSFVARDSAGHDHDRVDLTLVRTAVSLTVTPAPELQSDGEEGQLSVQLQGAGADTRIEVLDQNDAVILSAAYTDDQTWTRALPMPERGTSQAVTVQAVGPDARVLATQRIMLVRTAAPVANWIVPTAVAVLLLGSAIWPIRKMTAPKPIADKSPTKLAATPRIYAKPDNTPKIETIPAEMPEIILTVDPGIVAEITIINEEESDEAS